MSTESTWYHENFEHTGSSIGFRVVKKLDEVQSPFQKIEIFETTDWGNLMVIDGAIMLTTRDNFLYHEMMSHPVLNAHPAPKQVAVIGGGDCGTLREVLKHPEVAHAVQVEIDERVTRLSEQYFPELCESNNDPRAELYFGDGVQWMKEVDAESLDVVIIDSTDPVGVAEGLFGKRFYIDVLRALKPDGLLVQQSESPLLHLDLIREMHSAMREVGFAQTHLLHFPQPIYPSGWWSGTLACKSPEPLNERLSEPAIKRLNTRYYNAAIHRAAFALPNYIKEALDAPGSGG